MRFRDVFFFVAVVFLPFCLFGDDEEDESKLFQRVSSLGGEIILAREGARSEKLIRGLVFHGAGKNQSFLPANLKIPTMRGKQQNELNDDSLKELLELPELLHLSSVSISFNSKLTDQGMYQLAHLATLTTLRLTECRGITDDGLKAFEGNDKLMLLELHNCKKITDKGMNSLGRMTNLKSLSIRGCQQITDAGVAELTNLEHLTSLDLQKTRVTGAGLQDLDQLFNLRTLYLSSRQLNDADLKQLQGMKRLGLLELIGCDRITDNGIKELNHAIPKLLVVRRAAGAEVPFR